MSKRYTLFFSILIATMLIAACATMQPRPPKGDDRLAMQYNLYTVELDIRGYAANEDPDVYWSNAPDACLNTFADVPEEQRYEICVQEPSVDVEDGVIYFEGDIAIATIWLLFRHIEHYQQQGGAPIHTLVINSPGGEITAGLALAEWIVDNEVDVVMEGICFSSCANYVFPAGKNKIVAPNTTIAWHGSANDHVLRGAYDGLTGQELIEDEIVQSAETEYPSLSGAALEAKLDLELELTYAMHERERRFYERVGADKRIADVGLEAHTIEALYERQEESGSDFWTIDPAYFEAFGIDNVTVEGDYYTGDPEEVYFLDLSTVDGF